jgi:hypothetical protein
MSLVTEHLEYESFDQVYAGRLCQGILKFVYKAGNIVNDMIGFFGLVIRYVVFVTEKFSHD